VLPNEQLPAGSESGRDAAVYVCSSPVRTALTQAATPNEQTWLAVDRERTDWELRDRKLALPAADVASDVYRSLSSFEDLAEVVEAGAPLRSAQAPWFPSMPEVSGSASSERFDAQWQSKSGTPLHEERGANGAGSDAILNCSTTAIGSQFCGGRRRRMPLFMLAFQYWLGERGQPVAHRC